MSLVTSLRSEPGSVETSPIAVVTGVKGAKITLELTRREGGSWPRATVGRFVGIRAASAYLVGVVTDLAADLPESGAGDIRRAHAGLDLLGEIVTDASGRKVFRRGVAEYPAIGDVAELIAGRDLRLIYGTSSSRTIRIGSLQQDPAVPALIDVDGLLSRHFAVLGTTGVGKSSGVAVILGEILKVRPDLRIFLLDGHNEYSRTFGHCASVIGARDLKLPFWLFNFEETIDVVYGGRPGVAEEIEILSELIPIAKSTYGQYKSSADRLTLKRSDPRQSGFTVDTPVPYLLQDLIALIDERMGRLENRSSRMHYHRLMSRVEAIRNDPRYAFMFENANVGGDMMGEIVSHLFRLVPDGRPMTIMQLAGLPAEVTDAVVCVLCRLAFEFGMWSEGAVPLLFVCEEAHRYASAHTGVGFNPTRRALSRIAKEGRKYGVFLGLVTQRPAELDPTIISQCSTLFAMRMANEHDQNLLRSAVSDAAANLLPFVPSLGTREVIGFGEGVPLPARMIFSELPLVKIPSSETGLSSPDRAAVASDRDFVQSVVDRWRGATMTVKGRPEEEREAAPPVAASATRLSHTLEQARSRLLKRAGDGPELGAGSLAAPPPGLATRSF